jgi:hypothetical protein
MISRHNIIEQAAVSINRSFSALMVMIIYLASYVAVSYLAAT